MWPRWRGRPSPRGADLLGVAGGDGTQALVAGIAAQHGIPFMVITAGTRNHFALDLGLDRENPAACLDALSDGVELRVDLGVIGGQTFVNNASFGAYAEVVESPAYRDDKLDTTLKLLPDLLQGHRGARLSARADGVEIARAAGSAGGQQPVRNRGHRRAEPPGPAGSAACSAWWGSRCDSARQAVGLLRGSARCRAERAGHAEEIEITADAPADPGRHRRRGGVAAHAGAVHDPPRRAPRVGAAGPPGVTPPKPPVNWARLRRLAAPLKRQLRRSNSPSRGA